MPIRRINKNTVEYSKDKKKEVKPLTLEEAQRILEGVANHG
jgi:hypothetical protein